MKDYLLLFARISFYAIVYMVTAILWLLIIASLYFLFTGTGNLA